MKLKLNQSESKRMQSAWSGSSKRMKVFCACCLCLFVPSVIFSLGLFFGLDFLVPMGQMNVMGASPTVRELLLPAAIVSAIGLLWIIVIVKK